MISTPFEFSRQNDVQFHSINELSECQIWVKMKFCLFVNVENS